MMGININIEDPIDQTKRARISGTRLQVISASEQLYNKNDAPFFRFADTVGDGSGTTNVIGNYDQVEGIHRIKVPVGQNMLIHRMIITIRDAGVFRADHYGSIGAALSEGIEVRIADGAATILDITDGQPVVHNLGWAERCYDTAFQGFAAGDNFLSARWTFEKAGQPLQLSSGQELQIITNDDLTGLVEHYFNVQGHLTSKSFPQP